MANKRILDLTAVSSVAASDEFEVQKSGESTSKKATLTQITQIEATARAAADDAIELAVGLNANGTYPPLTTSWYLRTADHIAITDRGGIVEDLPYDIMNALRILDYQINVLATQTLVSPILAKTVICSAADILTCNAIPKVIIAGTAKYSIEIISIVGVYYYGSAVYELGTDDMYIRYDDVSHIITGTLPYDLFELNEDWTFKATMPNTGIGLHTGAGIEMYCDTPPTLGNGNLLLHILYRSIYSGRDE